MDGHGWQLALILGLILVNAVFSGSETALVSLRDGQLQRLERASPGGQVLARLARDPNRYLATIQIGITLAGFLASRCGRGVAGRAAGTPSRVPARVGRTRNDLAGHRPARVSGPRGR